MLDMGFAEDIEAIMDAVPGERQTVLFSATLPKRIDGLVRQYLRDPVRIRIQRDQPGTENAGCARSPISFPASTRRTRSAGCWTSSRPLQR